MLGLGVGRRAHDLGGSVRYALDALPPVGGSADLAGFRALCAGAESPVRPRSEFVRPDAARRFRSIAPRVKIPLPSGAVVGVDWTLKDGTVYYTVTAPDEAVEIFTGQGERKSAGESQHFPDARTACGFVPVTGASGLVSECGSFYRIRTFYYNFFRLSRLIQIKRLARVRIVLKG